MKIHFEEIELIKYGSHLDTSFSITPGRHLITGINGVGKSSIMEALVASIYKSTRHKDPSQNHEGDACVKTKFRIDDNYYNIKRFWHPSDKVKSPQLFLDGNEVGLRRATETDKEILNVIQLPYDLFTMVVVVMQGLPSNFASLGPTIRKTIVETLFGDSIWDQYRKLFSNALKSDQKIGNDVQFTYSGEKEKMISLNSRIETAKELGSNSDNDYEKEIKKIEEDLLQAEETIKSFKDRNSEFLDESKEVHFRDKINILRDSTNSISRRKIELNKVVETGKCYACERDYPHVMVDSARKELDFLGPKHTKIKEIESSVTLSLNSCTQKKSELSSLSSSLLLAKSRLKDKKTSKPKQGIDFSEQEKELEGITATVNGLNSQLNDLNAALSNLKYLDGLLKPSSKFRTETLKDRIGCINEIIGAITPLLFGEVECSLSLDSTGLEIELVRDGKKLDYKEFSGGERRRLDLIFIFSFQKFIQESSGISSNLIVFDEIFDNLDAEGVESTLNCIESLFPEASCIYVISHQQNIKSHFDSIIEVEKNDGISTVNHLGGN